MKGEKISLKIICKTNIHIIKCVSRQDILLKNLDEKFEI